MIFELAADFAAALAGLPERHPKRRLLSLLEEAIRRDIHFIDRHPTTLFQCMWNTCWWYDCDEAAGHYVQPDGGPTDPRLPWNLRGRKLSEVLARWREGRDNRIPTLPWLRSLRPPSVPLDGGAKAIFRGHTDEVWHVVYRPGGTQIATASPDGTVRVWAARGGRQILRLPAGTGVYRVAYSPDGQYIAACGEDAGVWVWSADTGEQLHRWDVHAEYREPFSQKKLPAITYLAFSPKGESIACSSADGMLYILDAASGEIRTSARADNDILFCLAFSPDGRQIATGGRDCTIRIWDATTGTQQHRLSPEGWRPPVDDDRTRGVRSVTYSPNGRLFACGGHAGDVHLWDVASWDLVASFDAHPQIASSIAFSPDGRWLAGASWDATVRLWDVEAKQELCRFAGHTWPVYSVAWHPDGDMLASASMDRTVRIWSAVAAETQLVRDDHDLMIGGLATCPRGTSFATASRDKTLRIWTLHGDTPVPITLIEDDEAWAAAYSPDGTKLISGGCSKDMHIWDTRTGERLRSLNGDETGILSLFWSHDGRLIVGGTGARWAMASSRPRNYRMVVWDGQDVEILKTLPGHRRPVFAVAASRDGKRIVSGSADGSVLLWNWRSGGRPRRIVSSRLGDELAFSPDGKRVVVQSTDEVEVVTVRRGRNCRALEGRSDARWMASFEAGVPRLMALSTGTETTIQTSEDDGCPVGWYPAFFTKVSTHPLGLLWAGTSGRQVEFLTLEGATPEDRARWEAPIPDVPPLPKPDRAMQFSAALAHVGAFLLALGGGLLGLFRKLPWYLRLAVVAVLLVGLGILLYPRLKRAWIRRHAPAPVRAIIDADVIALAQGLESSDYSGAQMYRQRTPLEWAVAFRRYAMVPMLISARGADINAASARGDTALHAAAAMGDHEMVALLAFHGAWVHAEDEEGATALDRAVREGHTKVVAVLLQAGADPARKTAKGHTPLETARGMRASELVRLMTEGRARPRPDMPDSTEGLSPFERRQLAKLRAADPQSRVVAILRLSPGPGLRIRHSLPAVTVKAIPMLAAMLEDLTVTTVGFTRRKTSLAKEAARVLALIGEPAMRDVVARFRDDRSAVRAAAAQTLAWMASPKAVGHLAEAVGQDRSVRVRQTAAMAIGACFARRSPIDDISADGVVEGAEALIAALDDEDDGVRGAAAWSLTEMFGEDLGDSSTAWKAWLRQKKAR